MTPDDARAGIPEPGAPADLHAGDMARRVARRRAELGKSIEEVAQVAGIDPEYLRYFETNATARLSSGSVLLLAMALECTPEDLYGGRVDRPAGPGRAGRHPELRALTPEQCAVHLSAGGVGRVVFRSTRGPVAHPLNFVSSERDVVFSTTLEHATAVVEQGRVSFEIDRVDEALSEGWSVLVTGRARRLEKPEEMEAVAELGLAPWAAGPRHAVVGISRDEVTGRVILQGIPRD